MATSRIRLSYSRDEETPPNLFTDHAWFRQHQDELLAEYGECFVVIYHEQVIGVGDTYEAAVQAAEANLPPDESEITPVVELLRKRHPFFRVRPRVVRASAQENG